MNGSFNRKEIQLKGSVEKHVAARESNYRKKKVSIKKKCVRQKVMKERIKKVLKAESYERKDKESANSRKL